MRIFLYYGYLAKFLVLGGGNLPLGYGLVQPMKKKFKGRSFFCATPSILGRLLRLLVNFFLNLDIRFGFVTLICFGFLFAVNVACWN